MSADHRTGEAPSPEQPTPRQHPDPSRRSVIRGAAGIAGAGLAAGAFAGALAVPAEAAAAPARTAPSGPGEPPGTSPGPVIVHVRDVRSGEMDVFAGTSHTRLRDPDLAARLARGVR